MKVLLSRPVFLRCLNARAGSSDDAANLRCNFVSLIGEKADVVAEVEPGRARQPFFGIGIGIGIQQREISAMPLDRGFASAGLRGRSRFRRAPKEFITFSETDDIDPRTLRSRHQPHWYEDAERDFPASF